MNRTYGKCELEKELAEEFKKFLKAKGYYYEASDCWNLTHFEILLNDEELEICRKWLDEH